ncbi:NADP-dependent 3-hydroxy acid dehydrogenase YdfG [Nocardia amikacinitolerans]|uniref:NADP-dependent 3-hydroxy acid dehydrogenase YdfG n=1 Tax=Nocardia amikacinitolerans TaxID=756689 RepID=A0A285KT61_9NOCA|nr:SDR family oxidoreductase [Nocardia amikacinitolerans]MCP2293675.1 NADP-dependent 3-hydroxy acid dehydrogenase YdfG [Nocardia amikacinitolerans]SNY74451.1 NADP-dependent 3-hydroxy acid dehydrogenase YdfG [Nocardia amikacinitolerans]
MNQSTKNDLGTVLITGGASGLGAATVDAVRAAGGVAIVVDRDKPDTDVPWEYADLAYSQDSERAVRSLIARTGGRLDAMFTAVGADACGKLDEVATEDWERVVRANLIGTAAVIRAALPALRASRGSIVTCASTLGLEALPDATAYCASKFGMVGLTRALAAETAGEVGVTLLIPGGMDTAFVDGRPPEYAPPPDIPLDNPEDVAAAAVFAMSQPRGREISEMAVARS